MKSVKGEKQRLSRSIEQRFQKLRKLERQLQEADARRERASAKEAEAARRKKDRESKAKLLAEAKEFNRKHGNRDRPKHKPPIVTEERLIALGGARRILCRYEKELKPLPLVTEIVFGREGETRLIFTPHKGAWLVNLEGKPSLDELKRELSKAGRGLWNVAKAEQKPDAAETEQKPDAKDKQKPEKGRPDIAFYAVDALLHCFDWFKGLPSNEQQKDEVQFAIISTLEALERDAKTKARKLQLAFKLRTDDRLEKLRPRLFERLLDHTWMLSNRLQRPPSKKELRDSLCAWMRPQEFATLLKEAGLSWLRRGNFNPDIF